MCVYITSVFSFMAGDVHVLLPGLQADQHGAPAAAEEKDPGGQHLPSGPGRGRGLPAGRRADPGGQDEADAWAGGGLRQDPPHRLWSV